MMKTAKSKKKGNNADITPNKQDNKGAVRDPQIDIPDENAMWNMLRPTKMADIMILYMWKHPMDTEDRTVSKDTTTSNP